MSANTWTLTLQEHRQKRKAQGLAFLNETVKIACLGFVCVAILVPIYFMFVISVKDQVQFAQHPFVLTRPMHFENFRKAFGAVGPFIWRTLFIAVVATVLTVFLGSVCAFVFAQFSFTGKNAFFGYIIVLMMIPGILNLIPLYVLVTTIDSMMRDLSSAIGKVTGAAPPLRFLNTLWAVIIPAVAGGQIMMIFVLRTFFESQPKALFESARIDGAGLFQTYWHLAFPLAKPIIGTMAILNLVALWNEYIWPLIVLQKDNYTVAVGLKFMEGQQYVEYGPLMAGYLICSIPLVILFLFSMRLFIEGLSSGAIKM